VNGVVEIRSGRIRGVARRGVWSFSGIPYASSPAGRRRWRPPAAPESWAGIRDCDRFAPVAPQTENLVELTLGRDPEAVSEDCLTLNIWTPDTDGARRPVMVWIHGGSFLTGSGSGGLYRGGMLARDGDVVVVTINYRLGALGFLAHPALAEDGQEWLDGREWSGCGNWGVADQVAALHWVREHIHVFGGDPDNVTLFGESAGGMSVACLLGIDAAQGLFHRAIVQSGPPYTASSDDAAVLAEKLAAHLGIALTRSELERVPADRWVDAVSSIGQVTGAIDDSGLLLKPVVDGGLLARRPEQAVAEGVAAQVPLILGTTRDEWAFFALGHSDFNSLDETGLHRWLRRIAPDRESGAQMVEAVREIRRARGETLAPLALWNAIATEHLFRIPTLELADAHQRTADPGVGTYCYLFTWESPAFGGVLGSCHAIDIPFVFGTVHNPVVQTFSGGGDDVFDLSASVRAAWTAFARSGSPGDGAPPVSRRVDGPRTGIEPEVWARWDPDRRPTTVLGPWPGSRSFATLVDAPRDEEARVVAALHAPV
jgi:para-nitrobenzyl esterase